MVNIRRKHLKLKKNFQLKNSSTACSMAWKLKKKHKLIPVVVGHTHPKKLFIEYFLTKKLGGKLVF